MPYSARDREVIMFWPNPHGGLRSAAPYSIHNIPTRYNTDEQPTHLIAYIQGIRTQNIITTIRNTYMQCMRTPKPCFHPVPS